jgi:glycosyltransferase involved in cell wall biosynthesis
MVTGAGRDEDFDALQSTVRSLDLVITDNYATENALVAMGVSAERVLRVPWGPEEADNGPVMTRSDFGLGESDTVLLFPRTLADHYQPEIFVQALVTLAKSMPHLVAVFIESGPLVDEVKRLVSDENLLHMVKWQPLLTPAQFAALIPLVDAVVVSPRTDGTSVTVMEAMTQGTPVVSSLTHGSSEWVMDGITGWSFPVGDAVGLTQALMRLLSASPKRKIAVTTNAKRLVDARAGWGRSRALITQRLVELHNSKGF